MKQVHDNTPRVEMERPMTLPKVDPKAVPLSQPPCSTCPIERDRP